MSTTRDSFEAAFDSHVVGCVRDCNCGRTFYNPDGGWTWEAGELDQLAKNPKATSLPHSVGLIEFEGHQFVPDCSCWHARADHIAKWLHAHGRQIAEFFQLERKRRQAEADATPTVVAT